MTIPKRPEEQDVAGVVINDPKSGTLFIGEDVKTPRTRQVELHSGSGAHLKLFKDGGFELSGEPCDIRDNINSSSKHGLNITSSGENLVIECSTGAIIFKAREIRYESSAADEPMVIRSAQNIIIEANDSVRITAANVGIGARNKLVLASKGSIWGYGVGGVTFIEKKTSLLPTNISDFVSLITKELVFGGL